MSESSEASTKRTVMVTGGTGLVGEGIREFVSTDPEVYSVLCTRTVLKTKAVHFRSKP